MPSNLIISRSSSNESTFLVNRDNFKTSDMLVATTPQKKKKEKNSNGYYNETRCNTSSKLYDYPKTPPRSKHKGRRNPVTPCQSVPCVRSTIPRLTGTPSSRSKFRPSPASGNDDRFIPSRANLRLDICRASILAAEESYRKQIWLESENEINGTRNSNTTPQRSNVNNDEVLTPLQSEFRMRMRGALLELSHDISSLEDGEQLSSLEHSMTSRQSRTTNTSSIDVNSSFNSSLIDTSIFLESMLLNDSSFASSVTDEIESDPAYRTLEFNKNKYHKETASVSNRRMFTYEHEKTTAVKNILTYTDPYIHDQLHVLHRSAEAAAAVSSQNIRNNSLSYYYQSAYNSSHDPSFLRNVAKKIGRKIPTAPSRILDAPELVDDYYLNLISWGECNKLAVALGQCVYIWHASSGDIDHLLTLSEEDDYVTSVTWCQGHALAVGTNKSPIQIWDTVALKMVRTLTGHSARVGSLSWNSNASSNMNCLTSGSRDSLILHHDLRSSRGVVNAYVGHLQEVCGLKWNDDGTTLASGGNENYLCIWDAAMSARQQRNRLQQQEHAPRVILTQHNAAVKALAWCPFHKGLLASGGGTADRTIKFWNSNSGTLLNSIDTGSQVCSLLWSKHQKEICSSHGFSENQLILWKYPTMTKIQEFTGHTARVLHMEQSPDGASIVSAAADETLRFWDIFGVPSDRRKKKDATKMFPLSGSSTPFALPMIR